MANSEPIMNIPLSRQRTEIIDNLGLFGPSPASSALAPHVSCNRGFNAGNHSNSIVTKEGITIVLAKGNISDQKVDGIVNSVGGDLDMKAGAIAKSILQKAGPDIQKELLTNRPPQFYHGDVITTKGYGLQASYVFHGCLKPWKNDDAEKILRKFVRQVLDAASTKKVGTLAFPAVGTGVLAFPAEIVATCMFQVVDEFSSTSTNSSITDVRFIVYEGDTTLFSVFEKKMKDLVTPSVPEATSSTPMPTIAVPASWSVPDPLDPYKRVQLAASSAEYQKVMRNVKSTCGASLSKVISIERIENHGMYQQYMLVRDSLSRTCSADVKLERSLWHGTSQDALNNIYAGGFNRSYCGKNATIYGLGVYFARDFSYSAQATYSPKDPSTGKRYIFQCSVLTGHFAQGVQDMIEPPLRTAKLRYDSVTNDPSDPAIFVIFKDYHAYPEYLVIFN